MLNVTLTFTTLFLPHGDEIVKVETEKNIKFHLKSILYVSIDFYGNVNKMSETFQIKSINFILQIFWWNWTRKGITALNALHHNILSITLHDYRNA